jgi:F0F1-type ATP synthase membrane subunit b/b'
MNYIYAGLGVAAALWVILTFHLIDIHKTDTAVIAEYQEQIATLKADANARDARDKVAAAEANATVNNSEREATQILSQSVPVTDEKLRVWAIKQLKGI